jgi:hypothetical protein
MEPMTPPNLDLRSLPYMPIDAAHLSLSDFTLTVNAEEFRAGVLLWCAAWRQVPAGSLPNDDRKLAYFAGLGRPNIKKWKKVRDKALLGFVECSDGRLYHPFLAERVKEVFAQYHQTSESSMEKTVVMCREAINARGEPMHPDVLAIAICTDMPHEEMQVMAQQSNGALLWKQEAGKAAYMSTPELEAAHNKTNKVERLPCVPRSNQGA